jgi:two-component system OmpR family response regulator
MSILVVSGDDIDARLAAYLLTQVDEDVVISGSIADAEGRIARRPWSAVILDTHLPDGSGFNLLHTLTRSGYEGALLMLSASKGVEPKVRALEEGADDYIVRPYEPAELIARVRATIRRARKRFTRTDSGAIYAGSMQLNANTLEILLPGNRKARLTPNELRILSYLMKNAQRVVDHQELSRLLFETEPYPGHSNAVGVYIRRVRRKIEDDVRRPRYIVTVRGNGYQFMAPPEDADVD